MSSLHRSAIEVLNYAKGERPHIRLHEKVGKYNVVLAHHLAQDYLPALQCYFGWIWLTVAVY